MNKNLLIINLMLAVFLLMGCDRNKKNEHFNPVIPVEIEVLGNTTLREDDGTHLFKHEFRRVSVTENRREINRRLL